MAGKQSLKLDVYPDSTNCFGLCVCVNSEGLFFACTHIYHNIYMDNA